MKKTKNNEPDCGKLKCKTLIINGEKYSTLFTEKFENRKKWEKTDTRKVLSFLPGTVLELYTKPGDMVEKDEIMLVLEAMKMQNTYYYPHSGRIKNVNINVGDRIPKGFVMIEYE